MPRYKKKKNVKYVKRRLALLIICILLIIAIFKLLDTNTEPVQMNETSTSNLNSNENIINTENTLQVSSSALSSTKTSAQTEDWRIRLANSDNILPEDFKIELANIDETRQFDKRAIEDLNNMMNAMRKSGITNIWVQSAYRSIEKQKELYNNSINKYIKAGKTREKAEELTLKLINKPGASDHNLGLAVDFNNVDNNFKKTKGYNWLMKNAEDYGFILRYPEDKVEITGIDYESWHWRYVGQEHAKKMNELNMCLEEYVEYLSKQV